MFGSLKTKLGRKRDGSLPTAFSQEKDEEEPTARSSTVVREADTIPAFEHLSISGAALLAQNNPSPATRRPRKLENTHAYIPADHVSAPTMDEPPPAYSASPRGQSTTPPPSHDVPRMTSPAASTTSTRTEKEDAFAFLSTFDTLLLIDDSGSMARRSWRETRIALSTLLPTVIANDVDGIDIYFLNHQSSHVGDPRQGIAAGGYLNVASVAEVERIFNSVRPRGSTPTGQRLRTILKPYLAKLEFEDGKGKMDDVKPLNILTITDGVPSDDVESVLVNAAQKLDRLDAAPHQVGVQFFQVGNEDGAAAALQELDDELRSLVAGGVRDIVDTCTWMGGAAGDEELRLTADGILKVVLGAVVKRLDRRRLSNS